MILIAAIFTYLYLLANYTVSPGGSAVILSYVFSVLMAQSNPLTRRLLGPQKLRLSGAGILMGFFITSSAYQSGLTSVISVNIFPDPINSLEELWDVVNERVA